MHAADEHLCGHRCERGADGAGGRVEGDVDEPGPGTGVAPGGHVGGAEPRRQVDARSGIRHDRADAPLAGQARKVDALARREPCELDGRVDEQHRVRGARSRVVVATGEPARSVAPGDARRLMTVPPSGAVTSAASPSARSVAMCAPRRTVSPGVTASDTSDAPSGARTITTARPWTIRPVAETCWAVSQRQPRRPPLRRPPRARRSRPTARRQQLHGRVEPVGDGGSLTGHLSRRPRAARRPGRR